MSVRNLDKIFKPRRVALIGATDTPDSLGVTVLQNVLSGGFSGVVYPIDPKLEALRGIPAYPNLETLPQVPDLALVCSPAHEVPQVVHACGQAGVRGLVVLSGGFRESGAPGKALQEEIAAITSKFDGMRIIGPNSLGVIATRAGLNASHALTNPKPGHLAFVSESRALCNSVIDWAAEQGIGFSFFVSIGAMLDVGFGDVIDYCSQDADTRAIILYVQSIAHARKFMSAARAFARVKPIVAYKAGRFAESARAAASHTGAMVAEDAVYDAAFERAGVVRVRELDDVFDVAELLASKRLPRGARLAIIGNAGGPAVIATDALLARGGQLAEFSDDTIRQLDKALPPIGAHTNPVDLLDSAPPTRFAQAIQITLRDPGVDAVLVVYAAQAASDALATAKLVSDVSQQQSKPVLAAWMGADRVRAAIQLLNQSGMATHSTPEQAVRAFMHLVSYARNLDALYETPRDMSVHFNLNRKNLRKRLSPLLKEAPGFLTENQAKAFLRAYDIPVAESLVAHSAEEAVELAERIGFPVVLKILSPQIVHKVDVGGVALDLENAAEVRAAYDRIRSNAAARRSDAEIKGVSIQRMVSVRRGHEIILGSKKDPTFGAVIMVGSGGVTTAVVQDRALGLPPLNERVARRMLESLRLWPLLQGFRGQPAIDVDRLIEVMIRFSCLITDYPEIQEFDINPLLVTPQNATALDAVIVLDQTGCDDRTDPYRHLAIRPYPEEYVRHHKLKDGTPVTLRPVKPEDENLWHELIASASAQSIHYRFRAFFRKSTHEMAVQYCVIDYEREIAMVAEAIVDGHPRLIGVAHLLADANHETAEFAVIVSDAWQGRGLGGKLLDHCTELAQRWGLAQIVAETHPRNRAMAATFRSRGFLANACYEDEVVYFERSLIAEETSEPSAAELKRK